MEKFTAKKYIDAFIQGNVEYWKNRYPEGLSVKDICDNDTVDVMAVDTMADEGFIIDCGEVMTIKDKGNFETRYRI
jgi:hypothetical protein